MWRDSARAKDAASTMKITAQDLLNLGVIDEIISEPIGGAHREPVQTIHQVGNAIEASLKELTGLSPEEVKQNRRDRFLDIGKNL